MMKLDGGGDGRRRVVVVEARGTRHVLACHPVTNLSHVTTSYNMSHVIISISHQHMHRFDKRTMISAPIAALFLVRLHKSLAFSLGHFVIRATHFSNSSSSTWKNPRNHLGVSGALFMPNTFTMDAKNKSQQDCDDIKQPQSSTHDDDDFCDAIIDEKDSETITEFRDTYQEITSKFTTQDPVSISNLPRGIPDTFYILNHASMPKQGFPMSDIENTFSQAEIKRLQLQSDNVTVPVALILLFPVEFTSQTRARKESRRRKILLHRGPLDGDGNFSKDKLLIGKVGDRVVPGDVLAIQDRMEHNYSESANHHKDPPFHLPVVYEDDYFAIVNKPEGIVVFGPKGGNYGRMTIKSCLPWVITPPKLGTVSVLRRPTPVHRIDRGTSGLLVIAKTKPAMVELSRMFKERKAKKTYTAIVNGAIEEPTSTSITSQEAENMGVCIGNDAESRKRSWQIIDNEIEDQKAVTVWRQVKQFKGIENARNNTLSMVELKPKTGRYHQLRRHMAWTSHCPLLGDKTYDGGGKAILLRGNGFYLCSNKIVIEHPFYNSPDGRSTWQTVKKESESEHESNVRVAEGSDGKVLVYAEIDLPSKFNEFLMHVSRASVKK